MVIAMGKMQKRANAVLANQAQEEVVEETK
jgi:hypothetical protein